MYVNEPYPVYYFAKNSQTGLTSIYLIVRKPDGTIQGAFSMSEISPTTLPGRYIYTYTPTDEGEYLFSTFENGSHQSSATEYFKERDKYAPVAGFD